MSWPEQRELDMDFTLSPEIEDYRLRVRAFVDDHILPLESKAESYDDHENIREDLGDFDRVGKNMRFFDPMRTRPKKPPVPAPRKPNKKPKPTN